MTTQEELAEEYKVLRGQKTYAIRSMLSLIVEMLDTEDPEMIEEGRRFLLVALLEVEKIKAISDDNDALLSRLLQSAEAKKKKPAKKTRKKTK